MSHSDIITSGAAPPHTLRPPFGEAARQVLRQALHRGQVMAYPTETFYALGGNALDAALTARIFRLKGRTPDKSLPLLVDGGGSLEDITEPPGEAARSLMETFWPGALTLVFRASPGLPGHLPDTRGTVALRWSSNPLVSELLRIGGVPLVGTSANTAEARPATAAKAVMTAFPDAIDVLVDGGETPGGAPSTLVDTTTTPFLILRKGAVTSAAIRRILTGPLATWAPAEP